LSGVFSELKPGFPQIVFSRIRRRVHDTMCRPGPTIRFPPFKFAYKNVKWKKSIFSCSF